MFGVWGHWSILWLLCQIYYQASIYGVYLPDETRGRAGIDYPIQSIGLRLSSPLYHFCVFIPFLFLVIVFWVLILPPERFSETIERKL